jgi:DNA mismatch repair protein MutS
VARLAGLPQAVIHRAKEILSTLENNSFDLQGKPVIAGITDKPGTLQLDLFKEDSQREVLEKLKECNLDDVSPLQALNLLSELKAKLK